MNNAHLERGKLMQKNLCARVRMPVQLLRRFAVLLISVILAVLVWAPPHLRVTGQGSTMLARDGGLNIHFWQCGQNGSTPTESAAIVVVALFKCHDRGRHHCQPSRFPPSDAK